MGVLKLPWLAMYWSTQDEHVETPILVYTNTLYNSPLCQIIATKIDTALQTKSYADESGTSGKEVPFC